MLCNSCKKTNPDGSNFCQHCGNDLRVKKETKKSPKNNDRNKEKTLWDKFAELYDSKDEERSKYTSLMSNEAWELINRIGLNTFEKFIEDNKEQLNKVPYKTIERMKNVFNWCVSGGYWMWYAESFYNKTNPTVMKHVTVDALKDELNKYVFDNYSSTYKLFSEDLKNVMNNYHRIRMNFLLEDGSMNELMNETIEKLKNILIFNIIWGYSIALAEKKYRK